ncbi:uncharacterized protein KNAG_0C03940 [Huiozyma naganishii CBS 8797]|uniref:Ketopantoate reductase n=1 Tax=Huiozyma naganishii (strain ATCC MYA-139 / BCRC 22969 / CBS 8797 / KCTC 17520 / NBRC 10181 / NCYC 3082 / Yp74L-3) TaxID=1071383 RepID=J7RJ19_HUIN7|nr:hypothetical protein KNAG_0C03940 [Kazachstania naganishii CBS 8797]CCK69498.1 hypothetical protein KNAG_0C03940 [Kazachstania naganishii CBS 8797]
MANEGNKPYVLVIGAGGVGVIATLSLFVRDKSIVSLVVRSDYNHVLEHGYTIDSCDYGKLENWTPHHVFKDTAHALGESGESNFYDYIVVTTKNIPDGPVHSRVPQVIEPILERFKVEFPERRTNVVLIQNGIDIERDIYERFSRDEYNYCVLSGIEIIGSTKIGPGQIHQVGTDFLSIGPFDSKDAAAIRAAKDFVELYHNEGKNKGEFDERVRYSRWKKLLYNAAINTTTALVSLDVPRALQFGSDQKSTEFEIFRPAMNEIMDIAAAEGISLDSQFIDFFTNISKDIMFTPSMCVDRQKNQLMELEVILGNPLRLAETYNVKTPVLKMLYNLLILVQCKIKESKGLLEFDEKTCRVVDPN